MQESGDQGDEAEAEGQADEEKPEEVEDPQVLLGSTRTGMATVTMGCTTNTIRERCLGLAENSAGYWPRWSPQRRRLCLTYKRMHQSSIQANSINNGPSILEVEGQPNPTIASLKQKPHVQGGSRFQSPQLLILLHVHMKISLTGSTNAPYVRTR